jgi:6-pyruvoyltetrahydropterin/6-carboxytetrahydropterin synthase
MYTITKSFSFEAAHRLLDHPKCGRLHGHSYRVSFELMAEELNSNDRMVLDYADLAPIKTFIDNHLDHRYLASDELIRAGDPIYLGCKTDWIAVVPVERTTAESMAKWLYSIWKDAYPQLTAVTVCETANTTATYRFERGLR